MQTTQCGHMTQIRKVVKCHNPTHNFSEISDNPKCGKILFSFCSQFQLRIKLGTLDCPISPIWVQCKTSTDNFLYHSSINSACLFSDCRMLQVTKLLQTTNLQRESCNHTIVCFWQPDLPASLLLLNSGQFEIMSPPF